jgi:hypothetical protein
MLRQSLILLLVVGLMTTCSRDTTEFDVEHETTFTVEPTGPIAFPTPEVTTNSEQTFENHDTKASLVEDVRLTDLQLTIESPPDKTFSFLEEVHIYIKTDGHPKKEVAYRKNVPDNTDQIDLNMTNEKLDPYLKAEEYTIETEVTTDETIAREIEIRADLVFHVRAKTKIF